MRSRLFLSWFAIASIAVAQTTAFTDDLPAEVQQQSAIDETGADEDFDPQAFYDDPDIDTSLEGYDHEAVARDEADSRNAKRAPLEIRDALADEALDMIHEYGQDVDVSLEGYDHDAVLRDVEEAPLEERTLGPEGARRMGRMKPHYVQHKERDEDEELEDDEDGDGEDEGPEVQLDPYEEGDAEDIEDAEDVEKREEDYDEGDGLEDDGDTPLISLDERDEDDDYDDGSDLEDEGDTPLVSLEDREAEESEDVDYSLEGYDHSLLDRDSDEEYYDPDEAFHEGAYDDGDAEEQDFEEERVVQKGPPSQRRRDLADEDPEEQDDGAFLNAWSVVRRWYDDMMNG